MEFVCVCVGDREKETEPNKKKWTRANNDVYKQEYNSKNSNNNAKQQTRRTKHKKKENEKY